MKSTFRGFSLVELLVVIAILALLATFLGPAARNMTMGNATTSASQIVTNQVAIARQASLTRNSAIELRFLKYADLERPGEALASEETWRVRGVQAYEIKPDGSAVAISKIQRLPDTAIIDSDSRWSTIMDLEQPATLELPKVGTRYKYVPIRFRASGNTTLDPNKQWYLTIHDAQFGDKVGSLPANYITIQLDPIQGSTKMYRPGVQ